MPRVSFVIPAYNAEPYLEKCLSSVASQDLANIQIIVVNDGSTDRTADIAESFAEADERVEVIHQENGGLSAARNTGIEAARGTYICFTDSDDWVEPDLASRMESWCEDTHADVGIAGVVVDYYDESENLKTSVVQRNKHLVLNAGDALPAQSLSGDFLNLLGYAPNKIYRTEWLRDIDERFDPSIRVFEDMDFNSRVLRKAGTVVWGEGEFLHYIQRPAPSLGKTRNVDFLDRRHRSHLMLDSILEHWKVPADSRLRVRADNSVEDLWSVLYHSAGTPRPVASLTQFLAAEGAEDILRWARSAQSRAARSLWVRGTVCRGNLVMALVPFRIRNLVLSAAKRKN